METTNKPEDEQDDEFVAILQQYGKAVDDRDVEEQEALALKVFQHLNENQSDEPDPWLEALAEAHRCEAAFD